MKEKLIELKGEMEKFTMILGYFNSPFSVIDRKSRQKISKDIEYLNNTINKL